MRIQPFRAWRPRADLVAQVAAVPYDVIDTPEAAALAAGNPVSFLHISRAEIDLPPGADPHGDATYRQAAATLKRLQDERVLLQEPAPRFFVYRLALDDRALCGIVAGFAVDDYLSGMIRTHEKTRQDKEDDRTRHIDLLNAQTEPIFLVYRDHVPTNESIERAMAADPLYDFTAADRVRHTIWQIADTGQLQAVFQQVPCAYIADGHHRAAAAARVARERRVKTGATGDYDWIMGVLFPAGQVRIMPYNRCVSDLNGMRPDQFLARLKEHFKLCSGASPAPPAAGHVSLYLNGDWYGISWPLNRRKGAAALDVAILQEQVLRPLLGIADPRTDQRLSFVGGIRGTAELERRVDSGAAAASFSMFPTQVEQMMAIADAGEIMPPKSTWFEPKLRSGLFVHTLD